jgi:(1->4)-alpha-D-glucan 1-alpha-D-glucosylmutase
MPGVPDFYQGTELWDVSLVDPDNRRPVDFAARASGLRAGGERCNWPALAANWADGGVKLALTRRLLALRQRLPHVFTDGGYRPVPVAGADADHVIAFARHAGADAVIVAVGRHFAACTQSGRRWSAGEGWDAALDLSRWPTLRPALQEADEFAGRALSAAELFRDLPVAVFAARSGGVPGTRPLHGRSHKRAMQEDAR